MNRPLGLALLVAGIILLVLGFQASDSISSDFSRFFTGSPTDKAVWFLILGAIATIAGGVLALGRRSRA